MKAKIKYKEEVDTLKQQLNDFYYPLYIKLICLYNYDYNIPISRIHSIKYVKTIIMIAPVKVNQMNQVIMRKQISVVGIIYKKIRVIISVII